MNRAALVGVAAAALSGCAPTLFFNQSFLASEELKLTKDGYASLKSTGETFDLTPIKSQEAKADRILVIKIHGSYLVAGEGFKKVWRLWGGGGKDKAKYEAVEKLSPAAPAGFAGVSLEASGNCALFKQTKGAQAAQTFITADGDVDEKKCPDDQ